MNQDLDREFIRDCQLGKASSFRTLVDRYKDRVYTAVYRIVGNAHDAEDIAQETFIAAYRSIRSFDLSKRFSPWLMKIAANMSIDYLRRRQPQSVPLDSPEAAELQLSENPLEAVEASELNQLVADIIDQLPPKYRAAIALYYTEELTYSEIADALEIPMGTVKTYLHRGREILRKHLKNVLCESVGV